MKHFEKEVKEQSIDRIARRKSDETKNLFDVERNKRTVAFSLVWLYRFLKVEEGRKSR